MVSNKVKDDENSLIGLNMNTDVIQTIKDDLTEADINNDGRIDAEELKIILKKHANAFTDKDIVRLGELFYVARAGGTISHEDFLKRIVCVTQSVTIDDDEDTNNDSAFTHHRAKINRTHPLGIGNCGLEFLNANRPIYTSEELDVKLTHVKPKTTVDKLAYGAVRVVRFCFDSVSLWNYGEITPSKVFRRVIFLETVAAIPGFVAAMVRHFRSLRTFSRDGGMLQMFLDEANNERMHLLTFVKMKNPSHLTRGLVLISQSIVGAGFFILYNISPNFCHRFVGYVEEEACHTYTDIIKAIENSPETNEMAKWRTELAPPIARGYWNLGETGTVLDMMYAIRADEAEHRDVNHVCTGIKEDLVNPLYNPQDEFDKMLKKYVKDIMSKEK